MKFKAIAFKEKSSERIYKDYISRIQKVTRALPEKDQNEILMELNSHIYEDLQQHGEGNEIESLLNVLEKLGRPEEILQPLVADKKMEQATRTFNPVHVIKALIYNVTNGISYFIFLILYVFLLGFIILIGAKIIYPDHVGLFYKLGQMFVYGISGSDYKDSEILGNWFIPVTILLTVAVYLVLTFLLKLKQTLKRSRN
jgi:hypothetical protein